MKCFNLIAAILVISINIVTSEKLHPLSDDFIQSINKAKSTWTAGRNFAKHTDWSYIRRLMGARRSNKDLLSHLELTKESFELPEEFDSRAQWPHCPTISEIRDQGSCGSCWAFGAVEAMSDRVCIHSNGEQNFHFSADDVLSCCYECGKGCDGGYPDGAWYYWINYGLVSGGPFDSNIGCRPYEIPPCEHHIPGPRKSCNGTDSKTPVCNQKCEKGYEINYQKDLHFGANGYYVPQNATAIQVEIMNKGPVEALFDVYEDFLHYKSGVYQHISGDIIDAHAIKIFGWGVEKGVPYWNIANSWNSDWGTNGTFKILRGSNHVNIENFVVGGMPKYT